MKYVLTGVMAFGIGLSVPANAAPKVVLISLDGATPENIEKFLAQGSLSKNRGLGLLVKHGVMAERNVTVTPSLTAPGQIAMATGSTAARNNINANSFHLVASPFTRNISGFAAPIGGYSFSAHGPEESPDPTAQPLWLALRAAGKKVVTADHGFAPFHSAVSINNLFASYGLDSTKVRAVTSGSAVNVYINLQGREPDGTVLRDEYLALQDQIVQILQNLSDTNPNYRLALNTRVFDTIYRRPLPADLNDPSFGLGTSEFIGQDGGDVFAILTIGYNFDGAQLPVVQRLGDPSAGTPVFSVSNFYGAHGYDPHKRAMSAIFIAAGPDIQRGQIERVRNVDIAPTILKLLGVQGAHTIEGEPIPVLR